jgi:ribose-phosphate pyrophosphokinase
MDAFRRASAASVTAIIPYYGYAKGDKKDEPRVSIRGRVCAECIELAGADRVVTMDLHSPQVQGFFKIPVDHLYAAPILAAYVRRHIGTGNLVVVAPDAGFAKEARAFAGRLGRPTVICDKARNGHDERARIMEIIGDVEGRDCLIVDDFTISGGTLIEVARGLRERGACRINACVSHILLNEKGVGALRESPIERIISTDSVPNAAIAGCERVAIVSAAPLFAETIRRIHMRESVSPLFDEVPLEVLQNIE